MYDNLIVRAKRTVYKWWCIVYKPMYKLVHHGYWPNEKEPYVKYAEPSQNETANTNSDTNTIANSDTNQQDSAAALANQILGTNRQSQHNIDDIIQETKIPEAEDTPALASDEIPAGVNDDVLARANEIMARLNQEAAEDEAKKQKEIAKAREQAAEQERLAEILKANERNIDHFIQEGLSKQKKD